MKKGLVNVFISNIIFLTLNLLINLLIPKYVSIDTYSQIKIYTLYLSYAGFFSIGYNDGMYLKYGGKNIDSIEKKDLANNLVNYIVLIATMFFMVLCIAIIMHNDILIAFAFGMFSYNIIGYFKSLYQATGRFKLYGFSLNFEKIAVFIITIIALFIFKSDNYLTYIWIQVIVGLLVTIVLFFGLERKLHFIKYGKIKIIEFKENIKSGIILMIGNFSSGLFTTMDRWFVKYLLSSYDFAMYSFAASMETIINVFISPITITMYNFFCKKPSQNEIINIKRMALFYGFVVIAAAFPAKFILETFLNGYRDATEIIFFLFGAQLFYVIIKGIYVNIYKAQKRQKLYLKQMIIMIIIGFLLNTLLYFAYKNNIGLALGTFITSVIWFLFCEYKDKEYRFKFKEYVTIILVSLLYLICGFCFNSILGCVIYIIGTILIILIFMKNSFNYLINFLKEELKKIKNKFKK